MIWAPRQGWIGVDFGAHAVKVAQLARRSGRLQLTRAAIVRREAPWEPDIEPATNALDSAHELAVAMGVAGGFSRREAACVLSMRLYDHRGLRAPRADATAAAVAETELASVFGGAVASRIFDLWSVDSPGLNRNADNVNVLSISSDWSNRVCDNLSAAGLTAETLDGPPLALARALAMTVRDTDEKPYLIVDWGFNRITVCLVRGDRPLFVRCLRDCGYRTILEAIQKSLGVNRLEAEKVLTDFGLPKAIGQASSDLQSAIADIAAESLGVVAEELQRTLSYIEMNRRDSSPTEVWLFGGGATLKNADRFVERALGMRTRNWVFEDAAEFKNESGRFPTAMLGPSIALSALAWRS